MAGRRKGSRRAIEFDQRAVDVMRQARSNVEIFLGRNGIRDSNIFKLHVFPASANEPISIYRDKSQFTGTSIFWINYDFSQIVDNYKLSPVNSVSDVITESLLKNYAHKIYEWGMYHDPILLNMIVST